MTHNMSGGVNQDCVQAYGDEAWKCFLAPVRSSCIQRIYIVQRLYFPCNTHTQYTFPYIKSPIFVINSQYDTYQLETTVRLECLPPSCSEDEMVFFNMFREVRVTCVLEITLIVVHVHVHCMVTFPRRCTIHAHTCGYRHER